MKRFMRTAVDVLLSLFAGVVVAIVIPWLFYATLLLSALVFTLVSDTIGGADGPAWLYEPIRIFASLVSLVLTLLATVVLLYLAFLSVLVALVLSMGLTMAPTWKFQVYSWFLSSAPEWLLRFVFKFESKSHKEKRRREWDDFLERRPHAEPENGNS